MHRLTFVSRVIARHIDLWRGGLLLGTALAGTPVHGFAQFTPPVRDIGPRAGVLLTDSAAVARDKDAGLSWVYSGTRDLSGYTTPKMCRALMSRVEHQTRRWTGWDTVRIGSRGDTLGTEAFTIGRRCAERMTANNVESDQLTDLVGLAITLHNNPLALAALDRRVHEAKTPAQQGTALLDAVMVFHEARPMQTASAESLLVRFDALAGTEPWWKILARHELLTMNVHDERRTIVADTFDTTKVRRLYRENVAAYQPLPQTARSYLSDASEDGGLVDQIDGLIGVPQLDRCNRVADAMLAWPQAALPEDLGQLKDTVDGFDPTSRRYVERFVRRPCLADTVAASHQFPELSGATWFAPGSGTPRTNPVRPTPGRVTLLIQTGLGTGRMDPELADIRRLYEKYHDRGLDVILVVRIKTNRVWASPILSKDDVARAGAWYAHQYLRLPWPLAVVQPADPFLSVTLYDRRGRANPRNDVSIPALREVFVRQALDLPAQ